MQRSISSDGEERTWRLWWPNLHGEFTFLAEARLRTTLWILLAAVGVVLLIVCLECRQSSTGAGVRARQHELAVRAAIGSGRGRLARRSCSRRD